METPVFISLETLNLLDSILPTGSPKTDLLTLLAVHTCPLQVPGCTSACSLCLKCSVTMLAGHLLPNCTPEGRGHCWPVRETAGAISGTGKHLQRHLGFPWQRWTRVVRVSTAWLELVESVWRLQLKFGRGSASFHGRICEEILFERAILVSLKICAFSILVIF